MRAFAAVTGALRKNRGLIASLVARDLRGRYTGSFFGPAWTVLTPLSMLVIYTLVFSVIMRANPGEEYANVPFALWLLAGILPWTFLVESAHHAVVSITGNAVLIKKSLFDKDVLPLCAVASNLVTHAIGLVLLVLIMLFCRIVPGPAALSLPIVTLVMFAYVLGWAYLLAALNVYIRDIGQAVGLVLQLGFFLTPIAWGEQLAPAWLARVMMANPYFFFVRFYREALLLDRFPDAAALAVVAAGCLIFLVLAKRLFNRLSPDFADAL
jgi:ABC-type polysaccharide/polyol phosphate export permease